MQYKKPFGWCPCIEIHDRVGAVCGVTGEQCTDANFWNKKKWANCEKVSKTERFIYQGKRYRAEMKKKFGGEFDEKNIDW